MNFNVIFFIAAGEHREGPACSVQHCARGVQERLRRFCSPVRAGHHRATAAGAAKIPFISFP